MMVGTFVAGFVTGGLIVFGTLLLIAWFKLRSQSKALKYASKVYKGRVSTK